MQYAKLRKSQIDGRAMGNYLMAPGMYQHACLLYTSDAADDLLCVDLGGRRIIKQKKTKGVETLPITFTINVIHLLDITSRITPKE